MSALDTLDATETTEAPAELAEDEVRLEDGRVCKVRRTTALHGHLVDQLVWRAGFDRDGYCPPVHARFQALLGVESLDDKPLVWPSSRNHKELYRQMENLLARFLTSDIEAIVTLYIKLNGQHYPDLPQRIETGWPQ